MTAGLDSTYPWPDLSFLNGICHTRSTISIKQITDGTSHTYLIGEKYLAPDHYATGVVNDDNSCLYTGFEDDNFRTSLYPPARDRRGFGGSGCFFGSAHSSVWNAAFCDGSIHSLSFNIDPIIHGNLANRRDKNAIPADAL